MGLNSQDFYLLFSSGKFRKVSEIVQDGFSGMYYVLKILADAKSELSAGNISETFGVSTARTAVILNTLEKKGYIVKSKSKVDARKTIVKLTKSGETILNERKKIILNFIDEFLQKLDDSEKSDFYKLLIKLIS